MSEQLLWRRNSRICNKNFLSFFSFASRKKIKEKNEGVKSEKVSYSEIRERSKLFFNLLNDRPLLSSYVTLCLNYKLFVISLCYLLYAFILLILYFAVCFAVSFFEYIFVDNFYADEYFMKFMLGYIFIFILILLLGYDCELDRVASIQQAELRAMTLWMRKGENENNWLNTNMSCDGDWILVEERTFLFFFLSFKMLVRKQRASFGFWEKTEKQINISWRTRTLLSSVGESIILHWVLLNFSFFSGISIQNSKLASCRIFWFWWRSVPMKFFFGLLCYKQPLALIGRWT